MLAISFSHAISDKTLCETGAESAARIVKEHGLKPGQPIDLMTCMASLTLAETLWCLRAVKPSQRATADLVAWSFVLTVLDENTATPTGVAEYIMSRKRAPMKSHETRRGQLYEYYTEQQAKALTDRQLAKARLMLAALGPECPSQIAVNVSKVAIDTAANKAAAEQAQRLLVADLLLNYKADY